MQIIQTITHPDGRRKVEVFRRQNGTYGFEEWQWLEFEECWCPFAKHPISIIDTFEHALEEIKGRIPWIEELRQG
ncbi:MAG TPA: hypothetical protein VIB39_06460 [Candidatus Angelobacter sp.]|jgi:hypothetical protein